MMKDTKASILLRTNNDCYHVSNIDEFGLVIEEEIIGANTSERLDAELDLDGERLDVQIQIRASRPEGTECRLLGLTLANQQRLQKRLRQLQRLVDGNETLASRTYDELASGNAFDDEDEEFGLDDQRTEVPSGRSEAVSTPDPVQQLPPAESHPVAVPDSPRRDHAPRQSQSPSQVESAATALAHPTSANEPRSRQSNATITEEAPTPLQAEPERPLSRREEYNLRRQNRREQREERDRQRREAANTSANSTRAPAENTKKSFAKTLVMLVIVATMIGMAFAALAFVRSRSTLSVANSALVGNYLPIHAQVAGTVSEVNFQEGDSIKAGDVLMRLESPELINTLETCSMELKEAEQKVTALEQQKEDFNTRLKVVADKLQLDLDVAKSDYQTALKSRKVADAAVERMKPYVADGAVTRIEFDAAVSAALAAESDCTAKANLIRQIEFSLNATKDNVLILGDRMHDELGRIEAEIAIAEAEAEKLRSAKKLAQEQIDQLEIVAPRDGRVFVTYRQVGEVLKIADEAIALSFPGTSWAAGQVTAYQAGRIRPGQPVDIKIPSMGLKLDGVVSAVGHRAMYSKGNYTADFRGTTGTDVPVRVLIEDLPDNVPSGIRLEMIVNTGFGVEWLDETMGFELKNFGNTPNDENEKVVNSADFATN